MTTKTDPSAIPARAAERMVEPARRTAAQIWCAEQNERSAAEEQARADHGRAAAEASLVVDFDLAAEQL